MLCLIAVEGDVAPVIRDNLRDSGLYTEWEFAICDCVQELTRWGRENVDVLLLSRFLPGEDQLVLLSRLRTFYSSAHIVLLAGKESEQRRNYIKFAHKYGFDNIVTGKLPGDRPYTIFNALTSHKQFMDDFHVSEEETLNFPPMIESVAKSEPFKIEENDIKETDQDTNVNEEEESLNELLKLIKSKDDLERLLGKQNANPTRNSVYETNHHSRGILVLTSSNKGGVGKSTVAISLVIALARAGISVALVDFDLGSPNIATFFDLKNVPGIEKLAGRAVKRQTVEEVLVQKDGIYILPGPMDRTLPRFDKGQLTELTKVLTSMFPVVIGDTPPEYWTKPWLWEVFETSDLVLSVVDQSKFSEQETRDYAPYLLSMGVSPEKIRIVLNRFNPKLHNVKIVEKHFCSGFKKGVKTLPRVMATIPENWQEHVARGYKGEVVGLDDEYGCWHNLASEIASMAGGSYSKPGGEKKRKRGFRIFGWKK